MISYLSYESDKSWEVSLVTLVYKKFIINKNLLQYISEFSRNFTESKKKRSRQKAKV